MTIEPDDGKHLTSFEHDLDPEPDPQRGPVYVDVVSAEHARRPIIPASLRGLDNVKKTGERIAGQAGHRVAFHAVRVPWYLVAGCWWATIGAGRLVRRQVAWWFVVESHALKQHAATHNDAATYLKLESQARPARLWRGLVLFVEVVALVVLAVVLAKAPPWARLAAVGVAVPLLAHYGRPVGKPIVQAAIVAPRYRRLTADIVIRAHVAAGLCRQDRDDQQLAFGSPMARDALNTGSEVVVDLPYGRTFADAVKAKAGLASGLDVTEFQVFLTRDRSSARRFKLFVADRDPLAIPAGRTLLLDLKVRDIWTPAPFGLDERGRKVAVHMLWNSILIGAQPRKGKTYSARALALYAALDPYVRMTVVDGKNSPDWRKFGLVAHRIIFGTAMTREGDPVDALRDALREIKRHIEGVNAFLSTLPVSECPDGKNTRDLSRKYPQLRVWVLVMEEFQVYYELDDQDASAEVASLLSYIMAVGPSAGVIILSSSQKPSGIGKGDIARLFTRYRDNHAVRFALKCGSRQVSEAVLGTEAYGEGYDAAALPVGLDYRGIGILYGASDEVPIVRTFLADAEDAERILLAARRHREALGLITGHAAGETVAQEVRDPLADARSVFYAGESWVSWQQLASRMAEAMPEHYAEITKDAISAQVRALGVPSKDGWEGGRTLKGLRLEHLGQAIERREIEGRQ